MEGSERRGRKKQPASVPLGGGGTTGLGSPSSSYTYSQTLLQENQATAMQGQQQPQQMILNGLPFDDTLLFSYDMFDGPQNASLLTMIHSFYMNGSNELRGGIYNLTVSMTQVSNQLCELKQKISILEKSLSDLESSTENKVNELQVTPFNRIFLSRSEMVFLRCRVKSHIRNRNTRRLRPWFPRWTVRLQPLDNSNMTKN